MQKCQETAEAARASSSHRLGSRIPPNTAGRPTSRGPPAFAGKLESSAFGRAPFHSPFNQRGSAEPLAPVSFAGGERLLQKKAFALFD